MTRIAVTTTVRHAGAREFSGYLRMLDLESGELLHEEPLPESPWRNVDPNPRGGTRGARGLSVHGERLVVCNADSLFVFDSGLRPVRALTHPLAGAIHDVLAEEAGIWVTCANCDLLLQLGWDGDLVRTWCWRDDPALVHQLGFRSLPRLDLGLDYRDPRVLQGGVHNVLHLNGVTRGRDGLLLSFGRILDPRRVARRAVKARLGRIAGRLGIVRARATSPPAGPASLVPGSSFALVLLRDDGVAEIVFREDGVTVPNHNVIEGEGSLVVYNDSNRGRLVGVDRWSRAERAAVTIPGAPSFARGLARLAGGLYLVGSQQPLAVHVVDLGRGEVVSTHALGGAPDESVYAVCLLPDHFADPRGRGTVFGPAQIAEARA